MIYGFIGTGTITEAIVSGMIKAALPDAEVVVSPRNAEVAARLKQRHPSLEIGRSNQAVVDAADILILAVRPQIVEDVLAALSIPQHKKLLSLVAGTSHEKLSLWTGHLQDTITRAVPLPFVATCDGVTAVYPPDADAELLFNALGSAVVCETQHEFDLLAVATALMGTYFGILERASDWLQGQGLPQPAAREFLANLFASLGKVAMAEKQTDFGQFRAEFSTKGGLNEQVFADFEAQGGSQALQQALGRVLQRVAKR